MQSTVTRLTLKDLAVGQVYESGQHIIKLDDMLSFASKFDPQPFHVADDHANLDGVIASGWYTAAITHRLLVDGGFPIGEGMIGLAVDLTWPAPTRPNDVLRVISTIVDIRHSKSMPGRVIVTFRSETRNARNEVVQIQGAKVMI